MDVRTEALTSTSGFGWWSSPKPASGLRESWGQDQIKTGPLKGPFSSVRRRCHHRTRSCRQYYVDLVSIFHVVYNYYDDTPTAGKNKKKEKKKPHIATKRKEKKSKSKSQKKEVRKKPDSADTAKETGRKEASRQTIVNLAQHKIKTTGPQKEEA